MNKIKKLYTNDGMPLCDVPLINLACASGNEAVKKCLVEYGADINKEKKNIVKLHYLMHVKMEMNT